MANKEKIKEIPKAQHYVSRPGLSRLFSKGDKSAKRNQHIYGAHMEYGYALKEIADHVGIHYTPVSKAVKRFGEK